MSYRLLLLLLALACPRLPSRALAIARAWHRELPLRISIAVPRLCVVMVKPCGNGESPLQLYTHVAQVLIQKTVPDLMTVFWSSRGAEIGAFELNFVCSCVCKDDS